MKKKQQKGGCEQDSGSHAGHYLGVNYQSWEGFQQVLK